MSAREELLRASGLAPDALDRLAVAMAVAAGARIGDGEPLDLSGPLRAAVEVWYGEDGLSTASGLRDVGYAALSDAVRDAGGWDAWADGWLERDTHDTPAELVEVELGVDAEGQPVCWRLNEEKSTANVRIAGEPGMGKSQFLLSLLAGVAASSDTGFLVLDYKGDLATEERFCTASGARVIRLDTEPLPINPFQLPAGANAKLVPRSYAQVFAQVAPGIGAVQIDLLTQAMKRAFVAARGGTPTLQQVRDAVLAVYAEEGRGVDSVVSALRDLVDLGLFAEQSAADHEGLLRQRWILDLSRLGALRDFVAFVVLQFLAEAAQALPDTAFDPRLQARVLRGLVVVDEAHAYLSRRCAPLLRLVRMGRSKGIPVVLASQSLEDFRQHTELAELMPNTFLLRHGAPQDRRRLAGALGIPVEAARAASDQLTALEQFHALYRLGGQPRGGPRRVRLHPYFEARDGR